MTTFTLDEEAQADVAASGTYRSLIHRLSEQSVTKHFDAYADIAWDAAEMQIDPADPRWELLADDPLGGTAWYQSQPQEVRARIGLHRVVIAMKTGLQFENVLKRGLLEFCFQLPNGVPEFRYAYHEIAEETHHGMMFQEFVNRSGIDTPGLNRRMKFGSRRVVLLGRRFPALFFFFVLGGEDPIDFVQRRSLKRDDNHPLLERIMRIHVTEEARHLSFARHWLKREVPNLAWLKKQYLAISAPMMLGEMSATMLRISPDVVKTYGIPKDVYETAYGTAEAKQYKRDAVRKVRKLCRELGLINPLTRWLWQRQGWWDDDAE
jgi:hypothetical protein